MGDRSVTRIAILDRDATIIDVVRHEDVGVVTVAFHPSQVRILPGAVEGMRVLRSAGYVLAIATNQPGPAKGQFSAEAVARTNAALMNQLASHGIDIAALEVCMHHPEGGPGGDPSLVRTCDCRKPRAGMLNLLIDRLKAVRDQSWMIGDSVTDLQAGVAAGLKTALVFASNRCELCPMRAVPGSPAPEVHGATLLEVATGILRRG
jgi:D-glycero-D-manno-heptose 1,7-bisphosphate phosphatase